MWKDKHVVVTGGAGMVGSQLVELLVLAGATVWVADDFSRGQTRVPGAHYIIPSDTSDVEFCKWLFSGQGGKYEPVFAVFNLAAAVAGVIHNQKNHITMFASNVALQTVPIIAAEAEAVPHFLQVSSVCVYAEEFQAVCREPYGLIGEPHLANYGYAWSKRMGEKMVYASNLQHAVVVRPSNIFGPHDYFDERAHVIPNLIKKCLDDSETIEMFSPMGTTREFIFSRDVAKGMMAALEHGVHKTAYNLGCDGDNTVTLLELIELIKQLTGADKKVLWNNDKELSSGDKIRYSDASLAREVLGWQHETPLEDGLRAVLDWYGTG